MRSLAPGEPVLSIDGVIIAGAIEGPLWLCRAFLVVCQFLGHHRAVWPPPAGARPASTRDAGPPPALAAADRND